MPVNSGVESPPGMPGIPSISAGGVAVSLPSAPPDLDNETLYVQGMVIATAQIQSGQSGINAKLNAQVNAYNAQLDYLAATYAAAKGVEAQKYHADRQLEAALAQLTTVNPMELSIRQQEIQGRITVANIQAATDRDVAQMRGLFDIQVAQARGDYDLRVADLRGRYDVQTTTLDTQSRVQVASINKDAQVAAAGIDLQGRQYSSDKSYLGQVYEADRSYAATQLREQGETSRLQTRIQFALDGFNVALPYIQRALDDTQITPGLDTDWPFVSTRGVFTPGEIQEQVNRAWAQNEARSQSQLRQLQGELAGRGFSSNSPLFDVVRVGVLGQTLRANNEAATTIRLESAKANAEQTLKAQELRVNEHQAKNQSMLDSERNRVSRQVGFVGALAQLAGVIS